MSASPVVYIHTRKDDGKVYVGQSRKLASRERFHKTNNTRPFSSAVRRYGWDAFDHTYFPVETQELAENLEKLWIILLRATDPECGYNRRFGGFDGGLPDYIKQEIGRTVSRVQTGASRPHKGSPRPHLKSPDFHRIHRMNGGNRPHSGIHRQNWSWPKGKPLSEEHKRKISEGRRRGLLLKGEI